MAALGVWAWSYEGGSFEVWFASAGAFVCKEYPEHSHWAAPGGNTVTVDWGQFGQYTMQLSGDGRSMAGSYTGYPDDWRKAVWVRANTAAELGDRGWNLPRPQPLTQPLGILLAPLASTNNTYMTEGPLP